MTTKRLSDTANSCLADCASYLNSPLHAITLVHSHHHTHASGGIHTTTLALVLLGGRDRLVVVSCYIHLFWKMDTALSHHCEHTFITADSEGRGTIVLYHLLQVHMGKGLRGNKNLWFNGSLATNNWNISLRDEENWFCFFNGSNFIKSSGLYSNAQCRKTHAGLAMDDKCPVFEPHTTSRP
jgi:hypothetical protein